MKVGYAEKERQNTDRRDVERKLKSGFDFNVPTVHFQVGVGHCKFNEDNEEYLEVYQGTISADELNRKLTSEQLKGSILMQAQNQARRTNKKTWLLCDDNAKGTDKKNNQNIDENIDWILGHWNPLKPGEPRDIAPWSPAKLLSIAIHEGSYESKKIGADTKHARLFTIWLYQYSKP